MFVVADSEYQAGVHARYVSELIGDAAGAHRIRIASAEDTILATLAWYRRGGDASERQWQDVRGVVDLRGPELDMEYLRQWVPVLGIDDLLAEALRDTRGGE